MSVEPHEGPRKRCQDCQQELDVRLFKPIHGRCEAHTDLKSDWDHDCLDCTNARAGRKQPRCPPCDKARLARRGVLKKIERAVDQAGLPPESIQPADASLRRVKILGLSRASSSKNLSAEISRLSAGAIDILAKPFVVVPREIPLFEPPVFDAPPEGARTFAPLLDDAAAAGLDPQFGYGGCAGYVDVGRRVNKDDFVVRVEGKSMEDTIRDRALCLFRRDSFGSHLDGEVVLAERRAENDPVEGGRPLVKRLRLRRGRILLTSDNPMFEPIPVSDEGALYVVGRLLWVVRAS